MELVGEEAQGSESRRYSDPQGDPRGPVDGKGEYPRTLVARPVVSLPGSGGASKSDLGLIKWTNRADKIVLTYWCQPLAEGLTERLTLMESIALFIACVVGLPTAAIGGMIAGRMARRHDERQGND